MKGPEDCHNAHNLDAIVVLVYVFNFMLFFMRLLPVFYCMPTFGPMLFMIRRMLSDLARVMLLFVIFMGTYGVASWVLIFRHTERGRPGNYHVNMFSVLVEVFKLPYWNLFGELDPFLTDINDLDSAANNITSNDPTFYYKQVTSHVIFPFLKGVYMLMAAVLLMNLLIALFSFSINDVQEKARQLWAFSRHDLILEYYSRPILPQPLSLLAHLLRTIKWLAVKVCCRCSPCLGQRRRPIVYRRSFMACLSELVNGDRVEKMLRRWEKTIATSYFVGQAEEERKSMAEKLIALEAHVRELTDKVGGD